MTHRLRPHSLLALALAALTAAGSATAAPPPAGSHGSSGAKAAPASSAHAPAASAPAPAASTPSAAADDDDPTRLDETDIEGHLAWQDGPLPVALGHGVTMALPKGYRYLPMPGASKLMERYGNLHNEDLLGVVEPSDGNEEYVVTIRYEESGLVKDDEVLDAAAILASIREGEPEYNEERKAHGFPPIHADGWLEPPRYDKAQHQVVWALGVSSDNGTSVNLKTRLLGRRGYVALTLLATPEDLPKYRQDGLTLVAATTFERGERYEDFDRTTDKIAEYGLTGLVLGGVGLGVAKAAKVGLLAAFWKPILAGLLAAKKLLIAGVAAVGALLRKLVGRKKSDETASASS